MGIKTVGLLVRIKCDECGLRMGAVNKFGPNDYGCPDCGHPIDPCLIKTENFVPGAPMSWRVA